MKVIEQLAGRLEGWAAGLRLLLLTLQGQTAQDKLEQRLANLAKGPEHQNTHLLSYPQRAIVEYFIIEVLHSQPEPLQLFLLQTSMLSRLSSSLCDRVTGRQDSSALLTMVERAGLFLESLDGPELSEQWYRYHALFAEAMRDEAQARLGEARLRELSLLAGHWYEEHGLLVEAIEAALYAQDYARAATLIEQVCEPENFYEVHTLLHWLGRLPEEVLRPHPALCFYYALALLFTQAEAETVPLKTERMEEVLQMAEAGWRSSGNLPRFGEVLAFRAMITWRHGEMKQAAEYASQALELLPAVNVKRQDKGRSERLEWRSVCLAVMGMEAMDERTLTEARQLLEESYEIGAGSGNRAFTRATLMMLASVDLAQGVLHQPAEYMRQVLSEARAENDWGDVTYALFGLSGIYYEWNDLAAAEQQANEANELRQFDMDAEMRELSLLRLALVQHMRGESGLAQQQLVSLLVRLQMIVSPHILPLLLESQAWLVRLQLTMGNLVAAERSLTAFVHYERYRSSFQRAKQELLQARLLLAQGEGQAALSLLEQLLSIARAKAQIRDGLEMQVLMALAYASCKRLQEARQMPRIIGEFHGFDRFTWVATAFMLTATVMIPIHGKLSDLFGRKIIFLICMGLFLLGSAFCGMAQSMNQLIFFRAFQGLGAGGIMPVAMTAFADLLSPKQRAKWQGAMMGIFTFASILGPIIGGWITDHASWRWVFYVNLPIEMLVVLALLVLMPTLRHSQGKPHIDFLGAALLIIGVVPLLLSLSWAGSLYPWLSWQILMLLGGGASMLVLLGIYEVRLGQRGGEPILDPGLFKNRVFTISSLNMMITFMGMMGSMAFLPLYAQGVLRISATTSGFLLTPMMIAMVMSSAISGQIASRTGQYKLLVIIGMGLIVAGGALLLPLGISSSYIEMIVPLLLIGLGAGASMALSL